jgi:hypothetical protein
LGWSRRSNLGTNRLNLLNLLNPFFDVTLQLLRAAGFP